MRTNTRKSRLALVSLALVALVLVVFGAVSVWAATTWYVDAANCPGPGTGMPADPFCKIQDAINAAAAGDTINVAAGTYAEYLYINKDGLTIEATAGYTTTIIDLDGLTPFWEYGMASSSFSGRAGVLISGLQNTGGTADLVENVTFDGFTVQNAGVNTPKLTGTHDGGNNLAELTDIGAGWTPGALVDWYVTNASDYIDDSGGRQFFRAKITGNTADTLTTTYISGGDEKDWDNDDQYVITQYREWYDAHLDGRDDVRGIAVASGKGVTISDNRVEDAGSMGISTGRSRISPRLVSENITIDGNTVTNNHGNGISVGDTVDTVTITGNTVSTNSRPLGVLPPRDLYDHTTGIRVTGRSTSLTAGGVISGNIVSANQYIGISVSKYTDGFEVYNNTVTGHNLHWESAGIFVSTGWGFTKVVQNHNVHDNIVTGNIRGIIAYYAWDSIIQNNTVTTDSGTFDTGQAAIKIDQAYNIQVLDNEISCDGMGIELTGSSTTGNQIRRNTVDGAMFAGVRIRSGAHDNTFTNNEIKNTTADTFTQYSDWGTHDGGMDAATLSDSTQSWTDDYFIGMTVINLTDGSEGTITDNDATTVTAALSGGSEADWDTGDEYDIVFDETKAVGVYLRGGKVYAAGHAGTGNVFNYNSIHNNGGVGMESGIAATVDASTNYWGVNTPAGVAAEVVGSVDYTPWIHNSTDTEPGTAGFQPNLSHLHVDDDSSQTGTTGRIQEGVDLVTASTVNVANGTYTETVSITKAVTLTGESESGVIVQANASGPVDGQNTFTINAAGKDVTIEYMTIRHGDYGIRSSAGNVNVLHCTIYHNGWDGTPYPTGGALTKTSAGTHYATYATSGGAIRIENSGGSEIAYCTIYENDRGIRYQDGDNGDIHDNESYDNIQAGIYLASSDYTPDNGCTNTNVYDNIVHGNMNNGLLSIGGYNNTFDNNNVYDNWNAGVEMWFVGENDITNNTITHNNLYSFNAQGNNGDAYGGVVVDDGLGIDPSATYVAKILDNTISDTQDGAAGQKIGIHVKDAVSNGITIERNLLSDHDVDVLVAVEAASTTVNYNNFDGSGTGVQNDDASATLDAEENWWGAASGPGPVGPGSGDNVSTNVDYSPWCLNSTCTATGTTNVDGDLVVDPTVDAGGVQDLINEVASGTTIVLPDVTYYPSGGFTISTSGITIKLSDGTVIQASSPCFTISADNTTISGGICEPSSGDHGIQTGLAVNNLVIRDIEIRETVPISSTGDGIHIGHDVTNLQIFDTYIHGMDGDGIEYASGITVGGVHEVQGNLFQNNSGYGVNNVDGAEYNVEYNSWGHYGGPTPDGDGVNGSLDYTPWTHVALSMTSSGSSNADEVAEGYEITYTIKMDAKEVYGADFDLEFDNISLTVKSIITNTTFQQNDQCKVSTPAEANGSGEISFCGFSTTAVNGSAQEVFKVVFEGLDEGTVDLDLDETDDAFSMAPPGGGSNNIYASLLDDGSVTVYDATTVTGRIDLQGRADDTGAVMKFSTVGTNRGYGPFTFSTSGYWGDISANNVVYDTYNDITVSMDRYLDVTTASSKSVTITTDNQVLTTLVLFGGDADDSDNIDITDIVIIAGQYGNSGTGITDDRADINDDDVIDISDLVLASGNYGKDSTTAYSTWTP